MNAVSVLPWIAMLVFFQGSLGVILDPDAYNSKVFFAFSHAQSECYKVTVGVMVERDASSTPGTCNEASFTVTYNLGAYSSTDYPKQLFTGGTNCPAMGVGRSSTMQLVEDDSVSALTASATESPTCSYDVVLVGPALVFATTTTTRGIMTTTAATLATATSTTERHITSTTNLLSTTKRKMTTTTTMVTTTTQSPVTASTTSQYPLSHSTSQDHHGSSFTTATTTAIDAAGSPYITISTNHYCGHRAGGLPYRCFDAAWLQGKGIFGVAAMDECEALCDGYTWCVAYSFGARLLHCALMSSTGTCAAGASQKGAVANSALDLVAATLEGYSCKAKRASTSVPTTSTTLVAANKTYEGVLTSRSRPTAGVGGLAVVMLVWLGRTFCVSET